MDDAEFRRMLERYPVVRKKTHARVEWNSTYDSEADAQTASSGVYQIASEKGNTIEPTDSMDDALEKFLTPYFSSQESTRVQCELEKAQADFLSSLCLEDINDLCAQFVSAK